MKPFEGFQNKIPIVFAHDNTWHTVALTGIPDDTRLVTVETYTPVAANTGVRPTGTAHAAAVFTHTTVAGGYETVTMRVNSGKQLDFISNQASAAYSIIGAWGGPAVRDMGPTFPIATGWTTANSESWRDFDLDTLSTAHIPAADRAHLEAVVCYFRTAPGSDANARGNGSAWVLPGSPPTGAVRGDNVVKVDKDNVIEVYEGDNGQKGPNKLQNSWVYFVGYVLKGAYVNFNDKKFYRYRALLNPKDDNIFTLGDVWGNYEIASRTVSPTVAGVYWRMQQYAGTPQATYAREVGSTNPTLSGVANFRSIPGFPLNVDTEGKVEFNMESADTQSWIFGYTEEYKKRHRVGVTQWPT